MIHVILTERFKKDLRNKVISKKVYNEIRAKVKQLATIPTMGSADLPQSIVQAFGGNVRRLVSHPFLIVYEYDETKQLVIIYGLIHERQAR